MCMISGTTPFGLPTQNKDSILQCNMCLPHFLNHHIYVIISQLGRQLQMQNAMRERQMSMQLAGAREMFYWLASFYGIATVAMFAG